MRSALTIATACAVVLLSACSRSHQQDAMQANMQAPLDQLRAMVTQSALIVVQAACTDSDARPALIEGAAALLRRVTSGPEMARLHKMMGGEMNMDETGDMAKSSGQPPDSPQTAMHMAVHDASGKVFDLLDTLSQPPGLSCEALRPVSLAASAALLREQHGSIGDDEAIRKLERDMGVASANLDAVVPQAMNDDTPAKIRDAALALQKI